MSPFQRSALAAAIACQTSLSFAAAVTPDAPGAEANYARTPKLETMVVVASRHQESLRHIGASVSVLTEADIEALGFTTVYDTLRTLPGIAVSNTGGAGKQTSLRIRGEEGYRTLVLIDGIKISDPTAPQVQPQMEHLLSSNIGRIEVLRGPQGMMYGADSGGVIDISTKQAKEGFATDVSAEYGRYDSQTLAANTRGKQGIFDYSLSLTDTSTDGFNTRKIDSIVRDDDGYENTTAHFNGGVQLSDALRIDLTLRDTDARSEFDSSAAQPRSESTYDQQNYRLAGSYQSDWLTQNLAVHHSDSERKFLYQNPANNYRAKGSLDEVQYGGVVELTDLGTVVYGVDHEKQTVTPDGSPEDERNQIGAYVEWQSSIGEQFFYSAGVRHDDNDDFGEHTSYRATAAYLIEFGDDTLKLKSSYGTGFRAPSLYEISYNINNGGGSLSEETSKGFDAGFEYHWASGASVELVYFDQEVTDQIDFDLVDYVYYMASGVSHSKGIESSLTLPLTESFAIDANYTYNDATESDGARRPRRPRHLGNIGLTYRFFNDAVKAGLYYRVSHDSVDNNGSALDDYELVDLNISWSINPTVDVYARVENALDEEYVEIGGYNTARAAAYGGVRLHF